MEVRVKRIAIVVSGIFAVAGLALAVSSLPPAGSKAYASKMDGKGSPCSTPRNCRGINSPGGKKNAKPAASQ
jgi:hypothetical protein